MTKIICAIWWLLTDPDKGFAHTQRESAKDGLVTFFLMLVGTSLLLVFYYHSVNLSWLLDRFVAGTEAAQAEEARKHLTKTILATSSIAALLITVPVIDGAYAVYFFLVGMIRNRSETFGKWFAFVVWSSVPGLLSIPLGFVSILLHGNGQITPEQLNPTSLNELIFHFASGSAWKSLLDNISLLALWSTFLMVIGYRSWTRVPLKTATMIVLVPNIIFYGSWTAIIGASHAS